MDPCKFVIQIADDVLNENTVIWSWISSLLKLYKIWVYKAEKECTSRKIIGFEMTQLFQNYLYCYNFILIIVRHFRW